MTPEYRKKHLAHLRIYDRLYHAVNRDRENLLDRESYWLEPERGRAKAMTYYVKNREKIRRRKTMRLLAEDMIRDALA